MNCTLEYNKQKKDIKGGNKKKLISNLQKRKKNCDLNTVITDTWNPCDNTLLFQKLDRINLHELNDKKMITLIRTLKQKGKPWFSNDKQKIKNYVTQELIFELLNTIGIYDVFNPDFDYIDDLNKQLSK